MVRTVPFRNLFTMIPSLPDCWTEFPGQGFSRLMSGEPSASLSEEKVQLHLIQQQVYFIRPPAVIP